MTNPQTAYIWADEEDGGDFSGSIEMKFPSSYIEAHAAVTGFAIWDTPGIGEVLITHFRQNNVEKAIPFTSYTAEGQTLRKRNCDRVTFFITAKSAHIMAVTTVVFLS